MSKAQEQRAKLSALIRGMMGAVQSASDMAGQQHYNLIKNFFEENDDGSLSPRVVRMKLADDSLMDVPLVCLTNPSSYHLKSLEIDMAITLKSGAIKDGVRHGVSESRAKAQDYHVEVGRGGDNNAVKVKILFSADENMPEAVALMM